MTISQSTPAASDSGLTRRTLLQSAVAVSAGLSFARQPLLANLSQNDRPRIGCIGLGGMGTGDARAHANYGDILAVCDVDSKHAERAKYDE